MVNGMCELRSMLHRQEMEIRGFLRLMPETKQNGAEGVEAVQCAVELQKLRFAHEDRCAACRRELGGL